MRLNGNINLIASGHTEGSVGGNAYLPFVELHMESGVFHNISGPAQSGIIRFDPYNNGMEFSNDGGKTFTAFGSAGVTSIGVLGDTDLTGAVDLAVPNSGFMTIQDSANASPLLFSVDVLGLSGLWSFPTQGFNGSIVNSVSVIGATNIQGDVDYQTKGSGFLSITQAGQNIQWQVDHLGLSGLWNFPSNGFHNVPQGYSNTYGAAESWTVTHNLGTEDIVVMIYDDTGNRLKLDPDDIEITDTNTVTVTFNSSQAGKAIILGF